jgi:putative heme-binding domain-containing protein
MRISLRDQLAPAKDWETALTNLVDVDSRAIADSVPGVHSAKASVFSDADRRAIADVAPGVHNAEAAAFLATHLTKVKESPENRVRYLRHIARFGREADQEAIASILKSEDDPGRRVALIKAVQEGEQARGASWPKGVLDVADATARTLIDSKDAAQFKLGVKLIGDARLAQFREPLAKMVSDRSAAEGRRESVMIALAGIDAAAAIRPIGKIVSESTEPMRVREQAVKLLAAMGQAEAMETLVAALPTVPGSLQTSIASGLVKSPGGAERLLKAIESGKASARLLQERGVAVPIAAFKLKTLDDRIGPLLKGLPPAEARIQEMINKRRDSFAKASTDLARGASAFEKSCAACHQLGGKGARIGPQLDGVGVRGPDRLLEDVLDPNRNVDQAFRVTSLNLKDGRVVSGLLLREEGETLVLADAQGKEVRVARGDVEDRAVSQLSPMPANWADQIPESEFADLLAYLLAQRPKDEPARKP